MGMSTHIKAFIPDTDPEFQRHKEVALACMKHKIQLPTEVSNYFNTGHAYSGMFDEKLSIDLVEGIHYAKYSDAHDAEDGFDVYLNNLPDGVTKLRFYNSW